MNTLWKGQRNYFHQQGIQAWQEVPYQATCNPRLARFYIRAWLHFIETWQRKDPANQSPYYLIELGAGHGQLAYHCLKLMAHLMEEQQYPLQLRYVMTDVVPKNIHHWRQHPQLQPFIECGWLDFALYRFGHGRFIHLHQANQRLTTSTPWMILANYVFDSVPFEVYRVQEDTLEQAQVHCDGDSNSFDEWTLDYRYQAITPTGWRAPLLAHYQQQLNNTCFSLPNTAIEGIFQLDAITEQKWALMAFDKGYCQLEQLEGLKEPVIAVHGSHSWAVNFHAVQYQVQHMGGQAAFTSPYPNLQQACFVHLNDSQLSQNVAQAMIEILNDYEPWRRRDMYELASTRATIPFKQFAAHIKGLYYDTAISQVLLPHLDTVALSEQEQQELVTLLNKIIDHFYWVPGNEASLVYFSDFLQSMSD